MAAWLWRFSRSTDSRYLRECASHEYAWMFFTPAAQCCGQVKGTRRNGADIGDVLDACNA